jgi:ribosomal protein L17
MLEKEYVGSHRDKLFVDYANNLKKMIANVNERQKHLLKVLDKLFETAKSHTTSSKQNISS